LINPGSKSRGQGVIQIPFFRTIPYLINMPAPLPWIVQKFGGTSVGKLLDTITGEIISGFLSQYNVAVVCSARSGHNKASGSTSLLLQAATLAESCDASARKKLDDVIDVLTAQHLDAAKLALAPKKDRMPIKNLLTDLERDIVEDCEALRLFLLAVRVSSVH
jgi:aspartate kinase